MDVLAKVMEVCENRCGPACCTPCDQCKVVMYRSGKCRDHHAPGHGEVCIPLTADVLDTEECPVCKEHKGTEPEVKFICGHVVCAGCYIHMQGNAYNEEDDGLLTVLKCPVCRKNVGCQEFGMGTEKKGASGLELLGPFFMFLGTHQNPVGATPSPEEITENAAHLMINTSCDDPAAKLAIILMKLKPEDLFVPKKSAEGTVRAALKVDASGFARNAQIAAVAWCMVVDHMLGSGAHTKKIAAAWFRLWLVNLWGCRNITVSYIASRSHTTTLNQYGVHRPLADLRKAYGTSKDVDLVTAMVHSQLYVNGTSVAAGTTLHSLGIPWGEKVVATLRAGVPNGKVDFKLCIMTHPTGSTKVGEKLPIADLSFLGNVSPDGRQLCTATKRAIQKIARRYVNDRVRYDPQSVGPIFEHNLCARAEWVDPNFKVKEETWVVDPPKDMAHEVVFKIWPANATPDSDQSGHIKVCALRGPDGAATPNLVKNAVADHALDVSVRCKRLGDKANFPQISSKALLLYADCFHFSGADPAASTTPGIRRCIARWGAEMHARVLDDENVDRICIIIICGESRVCISPIVLM